MWIFFVSYQSMLTLHSALLFTLLFLIVINLYNPENVPNLSPTLRPHHLRPRHLHIQTKIPIQWWSRFSSRTWRLWSRQSKACSEQLPHCRLLWADFSSGGVSGYHSGCDDHSMGVLWVLVLQACALNGMKLGGIRQVFTILLTNRRTKDYTLNEFWTQKACYTFIHPV